MKDKKTSDGLRQKHNADLIRRMRSGEPLNAIDSKASWFPPRPVIQKDRREMQRLYDGPDRRKADSGEYEAEIKTDSDVGEVS